MRTVILLSAALISECINPTCVNENIDILSICMFIFIVMDVIEFVFNILNEINNHESRRIKNW